MSRKKTTTSIAEKQQITRKVAAGRPRAPEVDVAVLDAAMHQIAKFGYGRMSIDSIAREARVGKAAIYRRWSSKADIATAALAARIDAESSQLEAAYFRGGLVRILEAIRQNLLEPNTMALVGTLLAEEKQTPELIALFRERVWGRRRYMLRRALERVLAGGRSRRNVDLDAAIDMIVGALYSSYHRTGAIPANLPKKVVTAVLDGIQAHRPARQGIRRKSHTTHRGTPAQIPNQT